MVEFISVINSETLLLFTLTASVSVAAANSLTFLYKENVMVFIYSVFFLG